MGGAKAIPGTTLVSAVVQVDGRPFTLAGTVDWGHNDRVYRSLTALNGSGSTE